MMKSDIDPVLTQTFFLSAGEVNAEGEMALTLLTAKLIDIATAHANALGVGNPVMADIGCGWVLSRLTVELDETPRVNCTYAVSTWVESWNRHYSERSFKIYDPETGHVYGYVRSIWLVLNMTTRDNAGLSHLQLPENAVDGTPAPIERQAKHAVIVAPGEPAGPRMQVATAPPLNYSFKYCDVDYYRHVNTVRYIALLLNQYSLPYHDSHRVSRMELSFLHEALAGEKIELLRYDQAGGNGDTSAFYLRKSGDHTPILYARITFQPRTNKK
ncbi:MAG: hypothetical protein K2H86_00825 [Muribaculaceae bacterium]|nr:hypothetical protein [Muribaculaceae bacterium]